MPGLYLEEFEVGQVFVHKLSRTVYLPDSIEFACMVMDSDPTFLNEHWASQHARHKRIEIHPLYVFAIVQGVIVKETTLGTTIGNLYMGEIEFPNPVLPGDTIYSRTTILSKRESLTKVDRGVVEFLHEGFNQRGEVVTRCKRKAMMLRSPIG